MKRWKQNDMNISRPNTINWRDENKMTWTLVDPIQLIEERWKQNDMNISRPNTINWRDENKMTWTLVDPIQLIEEMKTKLHEH